MPPRVPQARQWQAPQITADAQRKLEEERGEMRALYQKHGEMFVRMALAHRYEAEQQWKPPVYKSLDPFEERTQRNLMHVPRPGVGAFTRQIEPAPSTPEPSFPQESHATWIAPGLFPLGIPAEIVPDTVDLTSKRAGRAFFWEPKGTPDLACNVVTFPACLHNPLNPPFPGVVPDGVNNPTDPRSCFSAGDLQRWDNRKVPQCFRPKAPWIPFHKAPHMIEHDQYSPPVWSLPVTDFFTWKQRRAPHLGGRWKIDYLRLLLEARLDVEQRAVDNWERASHLVEPGVEYEWPWADVLSWQVAQNWSSWAAGRDAVARTCLYIAEMDALVSWLVFLAKKSQRVADQHRRSQQQNRLNSPPPDPFPAQYLKFIGAWASTIPSQGVWQDLQEAGVPIYIASRIPDGHPLLQYVTKAPSTMGFDGDERYRDDSYNAQHIQPNSWWYVPDYQYQEVESLLETHSLAYQMPASIATPKDFDHIVKHDKRIDRTLHFQPWASYIWKDPDIPRPYDDSVWSQDPHAEALLAKAVAFRMLQGQLAPYLPPQAISLTQENDFHPIFSYLHLTRSRLRYASMQHFTEDGSPSGQLTFTRFRTTTLKGRQELKEAQQRSYRFVWPKELVTVYSDYAFPGKSPYFGRVASGEPSTYSHEWSRKDRIYFEDAQYIRRLFTWDAMDDAPKSEASHKPQVVTSTQPNRPAIHGVKVSQELLVEDGLIIAAARNYGDGSMDYQVELDAMEIEAPFTQATPATLLPNESSGMYEGEPLRQFPLSWEEKVARLSSTRTEQETSWSRRLFLPLKGGRPSKLRPYELKFDGHKDHESWFIYPLRIEGFPHPISSLGFITFLEQECSVSTRSIPLLRISQEVNSTFTADVAFRYYGDALWIWMTLSGVLVANSLLTVYPLDAYHGRVGLLPSADVENPLDEAARFSVDCKIEALADLLPHGLSNDEFYQKWWSQRQYLGKPMHVEPVDVENLREQVCLEIMDGPTSNEQSKAGIKQITVRTVQEPMPWTEAGIFQYTCSDPRPEVLPNIQTTIASPISNLPSDEEAIAGMGRTSDDEHGSTSRQGIPNTPSEPREPERKKRKRPSKHPRNLATDPEQVVPLTSSERRTYLQKLPIRAADIQQCWKLKVKLPDFIALTPEINKYSEATVLDGVHSWIKWVIDCRTAVQAAQLEMSNSDPALHDSYNWDSVDEVFGLQCAVRGLYGAMYKAAVSKWRCSLSNQ